MRDNVNRQYCKYSKLVTGVTPTENRQLVPVLFVCVADIFDEVTVKPTVTRRRLPRHHERPFALEADNAAAKAKCHGVNLLCLMRCTRPVHSPTKTRKLARTSKSVTTSIHSFAFRHVFIGCHSSLSSSATCSNAITSTPSIAPSIIHARFHSISITPPFLRIEQCIVLPQ